MGAETVEVSVLRRVLDLVIIPPRILDLPRVNVVDDVVALEDTDECCLDVDGVNPFFGQPGRPLGRVPNMVVSSLDGVW